MWWHWAIVQEHARVGEEMFSQASELKTTLESVIDQKSRLHEKIGKSVALSVSCCRVNVKGGGMRGIWSSSYVEFVSIVFKH